MESLTCSCERNALRLRRARNGVGHAFRQCLACGRAVGSAMRMDLALAEAGGPLPAFDDDLSDFWYQTVISARLQRREQQQVERRLEYEAYLCSPEWADRRRLVMERERGNCQGCQSRRAVDVHHRTYAHCTDEFLFELVALCRQCHERLHYPAEKDEP